MDWAAYIPDIIAFVTGGGLMYLLNWKANKRKVNAEAVSAEQQNAQTNNDLITVNQNIMREQNNEINDLRAENVFCKQIICKHGGCVLRDPLRGMGASWLKKHMSLEETVVIDAMAIGEIALEHGYIIKYDPGQCERIREKRKKRKLRPVDDTPENNNDI